jgi:toxin CptA
LLRLLLTAHLATALLLWLLPLPWWWPAAAMPLLLAGYLHARRRILAPARIARESDGSWLWHREDGTVVPVRLLPDTLLLPRLVLLHMREEGSGRRHVLPVLEDSLPPERFRVLRVALRLERV